MATDFSITSAGAGISNRQHVETTLEIYLEEELPRFFDEVRRLAMTPGDLTPAQVEQAWANAVDRVEERLTENQKAVLSGVATGTALWLLLSFIPRDAYTTAKAVQRTEASGATLRAYLAEAFHPDSQRIVDEGAVFVPSEKLRPKSRPVSPDLPGVGGVADDIAKPGTWSSAVGKEARDAATKAYNEQVLERIEQEGGKFKAWITRRDALVRETHALADMQIREIGERFAIGNDLLMYPHDPQGSPGETHGCRCIIIAMSGITAVP